MDETEVLLRRGLSELGLPETAAAPMARYARLLLETNQVMNLTAITDPTDVAALHFLDSAALLTLTDLKGKTVADVGTGAGFPGLPLKIAEPSIDLTLLDAQGKRVRFLETVCALRAWRASMAGRRNLPPTGGSPLISSLPGRWRLCRCSASCACLW